MILPAEFYRRDTLRVARELLGQRLIHVLPDGTRLAGRIVETEAYLGIDDPACHTFGNRRTSRTETMYASGGVAYVYLIYGMYWCLNAVSQADGVPEAVLIRALMPEEGLDYWAAQHPAHRPEHWMNGPGKLCRAMQIQKQHNGLSLQSAYFHIEAADSPPRSRIVATTRVGVDYAGEAAKWPLRFYDQDSPAVSRR